MDASGVFAPAEWAERQFGAVELGDVRRRRRAVVLAGQMARHPAASLPDQAGGWSATTAGYRLFDQAEVTVEALQSPHWQMTRQAAGACGVVLMIEDTTDWISPRIETLPGWVRSVMGAVADCCCTARSRLIRRERGGCWAWRIRWWFVGG